MSGTKKYQDQQHEMLGLASEFKKAVIEPVLDSADSFVAPKLRKDLIKNGIQHTVFDSMNEDAAVIATVAAASVENYVKTHGEMPSDEMLASAMSSTKNMMLDSTSDGLAGTKFAPIFDANTNTSEGVIKRNHQIALITPTTLFSATMPLVTWIPPNFDQSEVFNIKRIADSNTGSLSVGDQINEDFRGNFSSMKRHFEIGVGDGAAVAFPFDTNDAAPAGEGKTIPVRKGYIRIYHDGDVVATDDEKGNINGNFTVNGTAVAVSASTTVNYDNGTGAITFSVPPAVGVKIGVSMDVNIEKDPTLIPQISHEMESFLMRPHEQALTSSMSIQAAFAMKRELGVDILAMHLTSARNTLAAEKDRNRLVDMYRFAKTHTGYFTWDAAPRNGLAKDSHYAELREFVSGIGTAMANANKKAAGNMVFTGYQALHVWTSTPNFQYAPNYKYIPQPHYVGMAFGSIKIYCDPQAEDKAGNLIVAKGNNYGDAAYVAADAISAIQYSHGILNPSSANGLKHSDTLYELAYNDVHPYRGREYLAFFTFDNL